MQITYQKNDGSIIQRMRKTQLPYNIGDITSMGWKVLNVEYEYNNKYYSKYEYHKQIALNKQRCVRRNQLIGLYVNHIRTLVYYCIALGIINLLKFILGQ